MDKKNESTWQVGDANSLGSKLFLLLQKPVLWQRSKEAFWNDAHISKQLLDAHLNLNWDAASRRHTDIEHSLKWIKGLISPMSKILDLGCGPGLYTLPLSEMGHEVTGIDFSER